MLLSLFLVSAIFLGIATLLLLIVGHRMSFAFRPVGLLATIGVAAMGGELAAAVWKLPAGHVLAGELLLLALGLIVVMLRRQWNPIAQAFYATYISAALSYLAFAAWYTTAGGLSALGMLASALLFLLELGALLLAGWYAFDTLDVIARARWEREITPPDPNYQPLVSLQIAAYNEPPDMLIQTIKSVEAIHYPYCEIVVIDNNTEDPEVWKPVEEYCRDRPGVRFIHVDEWPGYKAGALNLTLMKHTDPRAEIVGVVDADYLVDPSYLQSVVGYFADPKIAFVQTPQDYREFEGNAYLTACYDAYRYFFTTSMPSRNERDSIIFAGTMGLIRRKALQELGGWAEWCITEDAEASLRMLMAGYSGLFIQRSFGRGIMPLTFSALKSQRFRWSFGGLQILRRHWRVLMPWNRDQRNQLTTGQRLDYLFGSLHWFNDLLYLGFTAVLLTTAAVLLTTERVAIRPLLGALVLLPTALIGSGLLRALWALRVQNRIGLKRAVLAFLNWLSLSWTVALACIQGLFRKETAFLRTPKTDERGTVLQALWAARTELFLALLLWGSGIAAAATGRAIPFLVGLFAWQGTVYASAPFMSVLNVRSELTPELERRRRSEAARERGMQRVAYLTGATAAIVALAFFASTLVVGELNPGKGGEPLRIPQREPGSVGPAQALIGGDIESLVPDNQPTTTPSVLLPTPTVSPQPSPTSRVSPQPSPSPTVPASPSPLQSPSPIPTETVSPPVTPSPTVTP